MNGPLTFRSAQLPFEAFEIVDRHLGSSVAYRGNGTLIGRHICRVGFAPDFDLVAVEAEIRKELDRIGWLFVTTGESIVYKGQTLPSFGIAPIICLHFWRSATLWIARQRGSTNRR